MSPNEFKRRFPNASASTVAANAEIQPAGDELNDAPALGEAAEGKEAGLGRVTLRYCFYRVRPQDPDNAAASTKNCTDGLRRCGLIRGDEPWNIKLEVEQIKVAHFAHEKTFIEIEWP